MESNYRWAHNSRPRAPNSWWWWFSTFSLCCKRSVEQITGFELCGYFQLVLILLLDIFVKGQISRSLCPYGSSRRIIRQNLSQFAIQVPGCSKIPLDPDDSYICGFIDCYNIVCKIIWRDFTSKLLRALGSYSYTANMTSTMQSQNTNL